MRTEELERKGIQAILDCQNRKKQGEYDMNKNEVLSEINKMIEKASDLEQKSKEYNEAIYHRAEKEAYVKTYDLIKQMGD